MTKFMLTALIALSCSMAFAITPVEIVREDGSGQRALVVNVTCQQEGAYPETTYRLEQDPLDAKVYKLESWDLKTSRKLTITANAHKSEYPLMVEVRLPSGVTATAETASETEALKLSLKENGNSMFVTCWLTNN